MIDSSPWLITPDDPVLITGAGGFIGSRVALRLASSGFRRIRCLVRPAGDLAKLQSAFGSSWDAAPVEVFRGDLLVPEDCRAATRDVRVVYHLAAGRGEKSFSEAYLQSVVTTRNVLAACLDHGCLRRFVTVSSFSVYSNQGNPRGRLLDETAPVEPRPERFGDAYCYAKVRQDQMVEEYARIHMMPCVMVRPGIVYGPGSERIHGRVGLDTFGVFLHLGGGNRLPLTYVDNCADAIVLAGLIAGIDGEVFNVVDDELPTSRRFLRLYKRKVRRFASLYVPHTVSYLLCLLWEKYSDWSEGQLPPAYNRRAWHVYWKRTRYTNEKLKRTLGWTPGVPMADALERFFASCREKSLHA